jgi:Ran GTPase-activating protein (RanGAP) involved in mRNA processing and transport
VEDLRCDRTDCIDLTNAELGDAIVLQLCDYIRNSTKLRSLKLIRNKISDEAFPQLMEACTESRLTSLNLGQNLLTDKALDVLAKCELKELRALTLSQNRINQRNCKTKVAEFKKLGLTVSI